MATQKAFASYQEIIDLHTESDRVSAIGIHTPNNDTPHKMFGGFFDQFKKFKYLGCSVALVPVARLPVDPLQVSYEAGEPTIDPRDVVNPILFHGCHGNDIGAILNQLYTIGALGSSQLAEAFATDSIDKMDYANDPDDPFGKLTLLENLYYKALVDNTWRKAHPQKGFKKSGLRPLIYKLATNYQVNPEASFGELDYGVNGRPEVVTEDDTPSFHIPNDPAAPKFFTNKLTGLGWLDTRNVIAPSVQDVPYTLGDDVQEVLSEMLEKTTSLAKLPKIFMGVILLPPAYKTEQYFRMIINHHFAFAGFRGLSFRNDTLGLMPPSVFDLNDADPIDPPEPGPDPPGPGPEPPTPTTYSATLTFYTLRQVQPYDFADLEVSIDGVRKSVPTNGTTLTWTGLTANTVYSIHVYDPEGYELVQEPSDIEIIDSSITENVTLSFQEVSISPVITLSNEYSPGSDVFSSYQIDDGVVTSLLSQNAIVLKVGDVSVASSYLYLLDGVIYSRSSGVLYDYRTMKTSNNDDFIVQLPVGNDDLIEILQSGNYTVEVSS